MIKNHKEMRYIFNKDEKVKHMKKGNVKYLKAYEADMITALFHSYCRQLPSSTLMEIDRIFTEETGRVLKTNFSCSNCTLKLLKEMGKVYFKENIDRLPEDLVDKFKEKFKL